MSTINFSMLRRVTFGGALLGLSTIILPAQSFAQDADQKTAEPAIYALASHASAPTFDNAGAAVDALKKDLAANDFSGLAKLLGLDAAKLRADDGVMETYEKIRQGAAKMVNVENLDGRAIVRIGEKLWPLPFPVVKDDNGKWSFDTYAGLDEIINRRVGENELEAIDTMHAYVDAQREYAETDHNGDGVLEYAQNLISSKGKTDGLYWPEDQGDGPSPAGDFADKAGLAKAQAGEGYFGYHYRILTAQGDNIAGGAYDYVINGHMIAGFALLAWPVTYGETGVHTFAVNQAGTVYEIDLGPATAQIVDYIDRFNPDSRWTIVGE